VTPQPPGAREWLDAPVAPMVVLMGSGAEEQANLSEIPVLWLLPGRDPRIYRWPAAAYPAIVLEVGCADRADSIWLANQLLRDGAAHVVVRKFSKPADGCLDAGF